MSKKRFLVVVCIIIVLLQIINITPSRSVDINIPKDADYICFVNFKKWSCFDRLYIYDVRKKKYVYSSRVQHGSGGKSTVFKPEFSNKIGSNCSSLGLYKIIALNRMNRNRKVECFRLRGLSSTNSNAESRGILIHPGYCFSLIPKFPGLVAPLIGSRGCFTVSILTMQRLKQYYKKGNIYIYAYT